MCLAPLISESNCTLYIIHGCQGYAKWCITWKLYADIALLKLLKRMIHWILEINLIILHNKFSRLRLYNTAVKGTWYEEGFLRGNLIEKMCKRKKIFL